MTGHGTSEKREAPVMRDVAVVGLGQMGRGIARNLDRAGRLAAAWDSNREAMQRAGLSPAGALRPASFGAFKTCCSWCRVRGNPPC
jgi:hypothetical protein